MKYYLMTACLCSLPVGLSALSAQPGDAKTLQSQQSTNQSEEVRTLAPGAPVEREISGAQRHLYQLALEAGQCLKIVAEQRGADISLTLNDSPNSRDGKQLASVENNRGDKGFEWLLWQAQGGGNYLLEVRSRENSGGSYRLNVETFAPKGDSLFAFQNYLEARRLAMQKKPELAEQVLRLQEESLAAWKRLNDPQMEGLIMLMIAADNVERDRKKSLAYYQRALSIFQSLGMKAEEARALNATGRMLMYFGAYRDSIPHFEQALSLEEYFQPGVVRMIVANLGSSYFNIGENQKALECHLKSLADWRAASDSPNILTALEKLSQQHLLIGESAKSLEYLNEGLQLARELKSSGPALLEKHRALQQRLNAKDVAWRQSLNNRNAADETVNLAKEIDSLTADLQLAELQIRAASHRYSALVRPRPLSAPEVQQMLDENTVLLEYTLGDKQSWLWAVTRDSISNYTLPPRAEINAMARNVYELLTARQPRQDKTEDERLKLIAQADSKLQTETATLSRTLLGPISAQLRQEWKGKRLAVVASGALEYVPFVVLPAPEAEGRRDGEMEGQKDRGTDRQGDRERWRQGKSPLPTPHSPLPATLIANHEVVNLPSASALALIRQEAARRPTPTKTLAALADPVFEAGDPRLAAARKKAPSNGLMAVTQSAASAPTTFALPSELARSVRSFQRDGFDRLVFSNEEADFITSFAPRSSTLKAKGFEANRQLVVSGELGRYRIVHFATHGLINGEHPELSGLVLSLMDKNGKPQDGFLRMHEIFNLEMPADLVVLSACQTALGKEIKGEGLVGLTRAFMYAGAERVVASLWQVDDQATSLLMRHFYRGMLKENLRPAAALRAAQIEMSKSSRWSSPYYWSGFIIQGEWK